MPIEYTPDLFGFSPPTPSPARRSTIGRSSRLARRAAGGTRVPRSAGLFDEEARVRPVEAIQLACDGRVRLARRRLQEDRRAGPTHTAARRIVRWCERWEGQACSLLPDLRRTHRLSGTFARIAGLTLESLYSGQSRVDALAARCAEQAARLGARPGAFLAYGSPALARQALDDLGWGLLSHSLCRARMDAAYTVCAGRLGGPLWRALALSAWQHPRLAWQWMEQHGCTREVLLRFETAAGPRGWDVSELPVWAALTQPDLLQPMLGWAAGLRITAARHARMAIRMALLDSIPRRKRLARVRPDLLRLWLEVRERLCGARQRRL